MLTSRESDSRNWLQPSEERVCSRNLGTRKSSEYVR